MPNYNTLSPPSPELRAHIEKVLSTGAHKNYSAYIHALIEADMLTANDATPPAPDPGRDAWLAETYHWYKLRMDRGADDMAMGWLHSYLGQDAPTHGMTRLRAITEIRRRYEAGEPDTYALTVECQQREAADAQRARVDAHRRSVPSRAGQFGPADRPRV